MCDSNIRDTLRIIEQGFPVFYTGIRPVDSKGRTRVETYDRPVACGGVRVEPGDLVVADADGVVVVPRQVEEKVLEAAREKVEGESQTRKELQEGKSLREVYNKYRIL